jgi:hypothetical protein
VLGPDALPDAGIGPELVGDGLDAHVAVCRWPERAKLTYIHVMRAHFRVGCRRGVLRLPCWHLQDGDRVQRVRQHDQGLHGVHCWDVLEHALADKGVRRVWGWHLLECWG